MRTEDQGWKGIHSGGFIRAEEVAEVAEDGAVSDDREITLGLRDLDGAIERLAQAIDQMSHRLDAAGVLRESSDQKLTTGPQSIQLTTMGARLDQYRHRLDFMRGVVVDRLDRLEL